SSCVLNDSIFIGTPIGIYKGSLSPNVNLGIFSNWYLSKAANKHSKHIASFNQNIYAELDSQLYKYSAGNWSVYDPNPNVIITNIDINYNKLVVGVYGKYIIIVDENN